MNILTNFRQIVCYTFKINCTSFFKNAWFFDKYAMKNNPQNIMQIAYILMASKNIDFDNACHMIA